MKVPIFVLTLVVIYGTYRAYADESTDLINESTYDENHLLNFQYSFDKSLSRNKRSISLSLIRNLALRFTKLGNNVVKTVLDLVDFTQGALTGQNVCPEIKELSFQKISKAIQVSHPIQTIKTIICYSLQGIESQRRVLILKVFQIFSQFLFKQFLPILHAVLNSKLLTMVLIWSPSFFAFRNAFNSLYAILRLLGYVP